ncbi:hypothetical protein MRX96_033094 [Rhipicephalus microplus]
MSADASSLDVCVDEIREQEWRPILEALCVDKTLEAVTFMSSFLSNHPTLFAQNKRAFRALGRCDGVEAGLPDVIGAIDACHVRITRPTECKEDYSNRKKFHSIIVQAVCDADMVFTHVFVGFPGRAHDARVLDESFLFEEAASRFDGGYLLGDATYPLLPWLLPPYRHVTSSWQPWMSKFNHVHSKQRVVIEITFGLLKGRFRRLDKIDVNSIPQAVEIVMTACVLHNLARRHAEVFEDSDIAWHRLQ